MSNEVTKRESQDVAVSQPTSDSAAILHMIERAATNPEVDMDKMERLWAMHKEAKAASAEESFNRAMSRAQSKIGRIAADSKNNQTHSSYASYAALDRALRPVYVEEGFALSFDTGDAPNETTVRVQCRVSHEDGFSRLYKVDMPADGKGAKGGDVMTKTHATGSAMSYGMRYLVKLIFNVAIGEDDDGNGADLDPITSKQVDSLVTALEETGSDTQKFLDYFGIDDIRKLPGNRFNEAAKMLATKKKKAQQDDG